jgi:tetratricopeptide (TPR) repeat protein
LSTKSRLWAILGIVLLAGLVWGAVRLGDVMSQGDGPKHGSEAYSLLGEALSVEEYRATFSPERMAELDADLAAARQRAQADPGVDNVVWHGRRLAYRGEYREAIKVYTEGLEQFPDSVKLLRHRGHRYITRRQLYAAVQDLSAAARLITGRPDEVEPDGIPNERDEPRSTLHGNVWYHLGLALYLQGDFMRALPAWKAAMRLSRNDDTFCATSYWTYLTLRRLKQDEEAAGLLERIHADMDVIENGTYRDLLLMFKGELSPEGLLDEREDGVQNATAGYGVGVYHLLGGDIPRARAIFRRILDGPAWPAFGHIAAEAELLHMTLGN